MKTKCLVAAIAAVIAAGCSARSETSHEEVRPVRSMAVGLTAGSVGATYPGEVRARYESKLGFRYPGKVAARLVEVGTHVKRGQVLMRQDPAQEVLQAAAAIASVEAAKSRAAQNRDDFVRTEQLYQRKFASQSEYDRARYALAESESQLRNAEAQLKIAANQRAFTELVADRDGVITAIFAEAGQVVAAGTPVITLVADGGREVVVSVPEARTAELRNAPRILVTLWANPGKTYLGSLRELSPDVDEVSRTYAARITIKDADSAVQLGMTASAFTPDVEGPTAIRLPLAAVNDLDGSPRVWVVDPKTSRVVARPVKLGAAHNDAVLIAEGLSGGEVVVTAGANLLHAGQKVKTAGAATPVKGAL